MFASQSFIEGGSKVSINLGRELLDIAFGRLKLAEAGCREAALNVKLVDTIYKALKQKDTAG